MAPQGNKKPNAGPPIVEMFLGAVLVIVVGVAAVALLWPEKKPKKVAGLDGPPTEGLEVGDLAPEIDGEDIDGKRFKLSDYRGKVVLLDFWGDW